MTSAWKQLLPLAAVNPGGRSPLSLPHVVFVMKSQRQQPNTQKELTLAFNKTPRVAEDAWIKLSDAFSNLFDREGERNGLLKEGDDRKVSPVGVTSLNTQTIQTPAKHISTECLSRIMHLPDWLKVWLVDVSLRSNEQVEFLDKRLLNAHKDSKINCGLQMMSMISFSSYIL